MDRSTSSRMDEFRMREVRHFLGRAAAFEAAGDIESAEAAGAIAGNKLALVVRPARAWCSGPSAA